MSFLETPRFPDSIARGATRTRRTATQIVAGQTGVEQRNAVAANKRRLYEVRIPPRGSANWKDWNDFVESLRGPADGFRLKDWADFACVEAQGVLYPLSGTALAGSAGAGYGVPTLQLAIKYTSWAIAQPRLILKPIAAGLVIKRNGTPATAGAGAGQYALDTTTGKVTWVEDQSRAVSSHTVGATHQFNLASAFSPNFAVGGRIFVTGVTGTAAALLNSLPLQVTNVAANVITVAVDTTGLTATGGTAYFYPQPTYALIWSGNFDVPVRFESDEIVDVIVHRSASGDMIMESPTVNLIELLQAI